MANETRVHLKHLLEDIRDSYSSPIEEIIVTELVANALDSGARHIEFVIGRDNNSLTVVDNGSGMRREELKQYHNIAATTKKRGKGIGFAGVGAKLSLLLAEKVVTETKGARGSRARTQWHLKNETRAPWKFLKFSGTVQTSRGTAVSVVLKESGSNLMDERFIVRTLYQHFAPLFHAEFHNNILRYFYKKPVTFRVSGELVTPERVVRLIGEANGLLASNADVQPLFVRADKRAKSLLGFGQLARFAYDVPDDMAGVYVSTYGKVIRGGWEWLGVSPRHRNRMFALIEIPACAEILTTNKSDFLSDQSSLKKYYEYRKAIQKAIVPLLESYGEIHASSDKREPKKWKPIERDIKRALSGLLDEFPELTPLVGVHRSGSAKKLYSDPSAQLAGVVADREPHAEGVRIDGVAEQKLLVDTGNRTKNIRSRALEESDGPDVPGREKPYRQKKAGLTISFEQDEDVTQLARIVENAVVVNTAHPAYTKAHKEGLVEYHAVLCVGWTLSQFIETDHSPHTFLSRFLASWGSDKDGTLKVSESQV